MPGTGSFCNLSVSLMILLGSGADIFALASLSQALWFAISKRCWLMIAYVWWFADRRLVVLSLILYDMYEGDLALE
jgi:hypothetical protein